MPPTAYIVIPHILLERDYKFILYSNVKYYYPVIRCLHKKALLNMQKGQADIEECKTVLKTLSALHSSSLLSR